MAYVKNIWVDQDVERPKTYEVTNNQDGSITLTDSFGLVTELGTPVNEVNMNHIEDGIDGCAIRKHNLTETFNLGEWVLGGTGDDEGIYKSLIANNVGNAITDDTKWEKVEFSDTIHLHALKSYEDAGELLTDAEGLADVKKYAHSTFDRSKFTVVGSPTITDDGIASGFSGSNLISFSVSTGNIFTLKQKIKTGSNISNAQIFAYAYRATNTSDRLFDLRFNNGSFFIVYKNNTGTNTALDVSKQVSANTEYVIELVINNGSIALFFDGNSFYSADNLYVDGISKIETAPSSSTAYFTGSIDLKQFSITVDGVEVFSGNKTGIDTIKPDDHTVVGTPTISADGIASGFSTSNYLGTSLSTTSANKFEFVTSFVTSSTLSSGVETLFVNFDFNVTTGFSIFINNGKLAGYVNDGSSFIATTASGSYQLTASTKYYAKIEFTGTAYKLHYSLDGNTWSQIWSVNSTTNFLQQCVRIGLLNNSTQAFTGSIDLNAFKVYVDGNLIYQPCLKIPYTLSKTGSKIVSSLYRDRVYDMYSQFGYAPYYTLSNTDFTLPQGEIYGLMQKNALNGMMPDYANGIEITNALPYTVVDNGYVNIYLKTTAVNQTISVTRNNVSTIVAEKYNYANVYSSGDSNMIPVGPGDIIDSSTTTMTDAVITYFPLLGGI